MNWKKISIILSVLLIIFIFAFAFVLIPLACGYKLGFLNSYNTNLESIYYVGATLGSLATVVAIFIAILIPRGIAKKQNILIERQAKIAEQQTEILEQQNKIALFDKRYELYQEFENLKYFRELLELREKYSDQTEWYMKYVIFVLYKGIPVSEFENLDHFKLCRSFSVETKKTVNKLNGVNLLFDTNQDKKIDDLSGKYNTFIENLLNKLLYEESRKNFIECFDTFGMDEFIDNLKKQLKP